MNVKILQKLISLYGQEKGKDTAKELEKILNEAKTKISYDNGPFWDEKDIFLITYADSFREQNIKTLLTLQKVLDLHLKGVIGGVHILPFYPYSSDRGFSVVDYYKVKQDLGDWGDVSEIGKKYRLMADLVLNHVSVEHEWFQKFLEGVEGYEGYFISFKKEEIPHEQLKKIIRPRATPILTPFMTARGERFVWTTFSVEDSTDQVDLNYKNPEVLLEIIKVILFYLEKGIRIFRLDAVPFIWKEIGTDCWGLPQVHTIIALFREILAEICPSAMIITQVSSPIEENKTYFGLKDRESQLIYNFSLPPLVLNAFYSQDNKHLNDLASKMSVPRNDTTFFNILAVHDGISTSGAKGFLSDEEKQKMFTMIENHGGMLSYRTNPDGSKSVVEMNSTWWSALNGEYEDETSELQLRKFITSYAICLSLKGIPAIYYLSLFGQSNDLGLYKKTGIKRDLNRSNYICDAIASKLRDSKSKEAQVFKAITNLIEKRKSFSAFHPNAKQEVLTLDSRVFAILRGERADRILAIHNVSKDRVDVKFENKTFILEPYGFNWVTS